MARRIISTIIGLVVAFALIMGVEMIGHLLFPVDLSSIDLTDPQAAKTIIENLPTGALMMVLLAYIIGSFGGGLVASLVAGRQPGAAPFSVGVILMLLGLFNAFSLPHPFWFVAANFLIYIPFAWLGHMLVCKREA